MNIANIQNKSVLENFSLNKTESKQNILKKSINLLHETMADIPSPKEENLLANNFLDKDLEQSKYIKSHLASFKVENDIVNQQLKMIESLKIQHKNAKNSGEHAKITRQGEVGIANIKDSDTLDELDNNLEEIKDKIKAEAKKALAAKSKEQVVITTDENGNIEVQNPADNTDTIENTIDTTIDTTIDNEIQIESPDITSPNLVIPESVNLESIIISPESIPSIDIII